MFKEMLYLHTWCVRPCPDVVFLMLLLLLLLGITRLAA